MMENILQPQPIEITRTIREKLFIIFWSWFLLIFVYQNIIFGFVDELHASKIINFAEGFSAYQLFWGGAIFPNVLKIGINIIIALLGGITVGYLFTNVRLTFRFFYSFFSTIVQLGSFPLLLILLLGNRGYSSEDTVGNYFFLLIETIRTTKLYAIVITLSLITVFLGYYFGVKLGIKLKGENYFGMDLRGRDTFLDVKWRHWLWFWIPLWVNLRVVLWIIYGTMSSVIVAIKHWKLLEFFGIFVVSSDKSVNQPNSVVSILWWGFVFALLFFLQLRFVWQIISGRKHFNKKIASILFVIFFGFVSPLLIQLILYSIITKK